jgi:hypothetical protein
MDGEKSYQAENDAPLAATRREENAATSFWNYFSCRQHDSAGWTLAVHVKYILPDGRIIISID